MPCMGGLCEKSSPLSTKQSTSRQSSQFHLALATAGGSATVKQSFTRDEKELARERFFVALFAVTALVQNLLRKCNPNSLGFLDRRQPLENGLPVDLF
jgi:hypothetical protein